MATTDQAIPDWTQEDRDRLVAAIREIVNREDIGEITAAGSRLTGTFSNDYFPEESIFPSDLDIQVWINTEERTDLISRLKGTFDEMKMSIHVRPIAHFNYPFRGQYKLPKFSLLTNTHFPGDEADLEAWQNQ